MADQAKTAAELIADFATNGAQDITAARLRNLVESIVPAVGRFSLTATAPTTFANTSSYVEAALSAGIVGSLARNLTYANGRLTYTGVPDIHVHVAVTLSMDSAQNNQIISMRVAKNATPTHVDAIASETDHKLGTGGDIDSTALHYDGMMSTGDFLSVFLRNQTGTASVTVRHQYFFILGMMDVSGL